MNSPNEIVITGVGVVCPIGVGVEEFWASLTRGLSGVGRISLYDPSPFPVRIAGEVTGFEPKKFVRPRKSLKVMTREIQMAFASAVMAAEQAGIERGTIASPRMGVCFGAEIISTECEGLVDATAGCLENGRFQLDRWGPRAMSDIYPLWMLKYLPNMAACHIGIALDAQGPNNTISQDDVSSLLAISESVNCIQRGGADVMIAGGASSRCDSSKFLWRGFDRMSQWRRKGQQSLSDAVAPLAEYNDDPTRACRPFDRDRVGAVAGEGAGALVLESREHAEGRGAKPLARILGFASGFEPPKNGAPRQGTAMRHVIRQALANSDVSPSDIGHVNANGLSEIEDDALEAQAIRDTLGDVPVTAIKSYMGNLGSAGGTVEMAASILAINEGVVPTTLNYDIPDANCPIDVIHGQPRAIDKPAALILSQYVSGHACAMVIAKP
jgi:3-oxoacyl-[acyl-carrier-protein] synthase II